MKLSTKVIAIYFFTASLALGLLACLYTKHDIHVTLDIRHIQDTATNIEDIVSGQKELQGADKKKRDGAMLDTPRLAWLAALLDPATPCAAATAYAADDDAAVKIHEMTPALEKAIQSRKDRYQKVRGYKSVGAVGEDNQAVLEVRSESPLLKNPDEEKAIRATVEGENADRETIYREIARQNAATGAEALAKIRQAWARVHREKSEKGDWVQVPSDPTWYASFLETPFAKNLDLKPKPGDWVQAP